MKESEFQGWVVDLFMRFGWTVTHVSTPARAVGRGFVPDSRGAGLLDLLMTHPDPPRVIIAEVKVDAPLTDAQRAMLVALRAVVAVVRERFRPDPPPFGVYLFSPGSEPLIEALARGADVTL